MRANVFTDKSLARQAGRFVWLAMNTEQAVNAPLRKQFPVAALPTYLVVDPEDEKIALRWVGGATVPQLHKLLDDGVAAVERKPGASGLDALLAMADDHYAAQEDSAAAVAYREVLAQAPADWPQRARVVDALLFAQQMADDNPACLALAQAELPRYRGTPTGLGLALGGLDAALALPAENPDRAKLVAGFEAAARAALADTALKVSDDDRSSVYGTLVAARDDAGDTTGKQQLAAEWADFLDAAAARAQTPEQRTVYDAHRLTACIQAGTPERVVPVLQAAERDLPDDYNPPARLALAYKALKRYDDALAASDRALARVYGPRQLVVLQARADIYAEQGEKESARRTLEEALVVAAALPAGQRSERQIAALKKKLEGMQP
jgi:tetratricopeptide (TPR) repeat protein